MPKFARNEFRAQKIKDFMAATLGRFQTANPDNFLESMAQQRCVQLDREMASLADQFQNRADALDYLKGYRYRHDVSVPRKLTGGVTFSFFLQP